MRKVWVFEIGVAVTRDHPPSVWSWHRWVLYDRDQYSLPKALDMLFRYNLMNDQARKRIFSNPSYRLRIRNVDTNATIEDPPYTVAYVDCRIPSSRTGQDPRLDATAGVRRDGDRHAADQRSGSARPQRQRLHARTPRSVR